MAGVGAMARSGLVKPAGPLQEGMPRSKRLPSGDAPPEPGTPEFEEKYPNLANEREMDRLRHIRAAREMGATQEQARRHATEEDDEPS